MLSGGVVYGLSIDGPAKGLTDGETPMAFVTEIVLFRARPGLAAETTVRTVAVAAEGCRPDGTVDDSPGDRSAAAGGRFEDAVVDGPDVRPYHFVSRSL
jgi:hypothetical protein